jgi:hypothetical protein
MTDIKIKTAKDAELALHRASCVILTLEQLIRTAQFEEPCCAAALSETLTVAYERVTDVMEYLDGLIPRESVDDAENA